MSNRIFRINPVNSNRLAPVRSRTTKISHQHHLDTYKPLPQTRLLTTQPKQPSLIGRAARFLGKPGDWLNSQVEKAVNGMNGNGMMPALAGGVPQMAMKDFHGSETLPQVLQMTGRAGSIGTLNFSRLSHEEINQLGDFIKRPDKHAGKLFVERGIYPFGNQESARTKMAGAKAQIFDLSRYDKKDVDGMVKRYVYAKERPQLKRGDYNRTFEAEAHLPFPLRNDKIVINVRLLEETSDRVIVNWELDKVLTAQFDTKKSNKVVDSEGQWIIQVRENGELEIIHTFHLHAQLAGMNVDSIMVTAAKESEDTAQTLWRRILR